MIKKSILLFILAIFVIAITGCETVKGAVEGFQRDWQSAQEIDDWIQRNLW